MLALLRMCSTEGLPFIDGTVLGFESEDRVEFLYARNAKTIRVCERNITEYLALASKLRTNVINGGGYVSIFVGSVFQ